LLLLLIDGKRGLREMWAPALTCGVAFGIAQFLVSNYVTAELSDIVAAAAGTVALVAVPMARRSARAEVKDALLPGTAAVAVEEPQGSRRDLTLAYAPYAIIIVIFAVAQIKIIKSWLAHGNISVKWPLLNIVNASGKPISGNRLPLSLL